MPTAEFTSNQLNINAPMHILGSVGIGTTDPMFPLHVIAPSGMAVNVEGDMVAVGNVHATGAFQVQQLGTSTNLRYPPEGMTANVMQVSYSSMYGNGQYIASSSPEGYINDAYNVFEQQTNSSFLQWGYGNDSFYFGTTSTNFIDANAQNASIAGEWVQLRFPTPVKLFSYGLKPTVILTSAPRLYVILGSLDGSTWTLVDDHRTNEVTYLDTSEKVITISPMLTTAYSYYRLVTNAIGTGGTDSHMRLQELNFYVRNEITLRGNVYAEGNVGVGTTTPSAKLEVVGTVKATQFIGDGSLLTGLPGSGSSEWTSANGNLYTTTTNVGIGTNAPQSRLHVSGTLSVTGDILPTACNVYDLGSSNYRFRDLYLSGNTIDIEGTKIMKDEITGGIVFKDNSNELLNTRAKNVLVAGNLGVGTTSPMYPMDVVASYETNFTVSPSSITQIANLQVRSISASADGNTIVTGQHNAAASYIDNNEQFGVSVHTYNNGVWTSSNLLIQPLPSGIYSGEVLRLYVSQAAISADGLRIVAARGYANDQYNLGDANVVEIFHKVDSVWTSKAYIHKAGRLGWGCAMSGDGNTVALTSPKNETNYPGTIYVYSYNANTDTWDESFTREYDNFVNDISLNFDGSIMAFSRTGKVQNPVYQDPSTSVVHILKYTNGLWNDVNDDIVIPAPTGLLKWHAFGKQASLSSDGNTLAISAPGYSSELYANTNALNGVYVYKTSTNWTTYTSNLLQPASYSNPSLDDYTNFFGNTIALNEDGTCIVIGANYADGSGLDGAGKVWIFEYTNATWSISTTLDGTIENEGFGYAVGIKNDKEYIYIGKRNYNTYFGSLFQYRFEKREKALQTTGDIDIVGNAFIDGDACIDGRIGVGTHTPNYPLHVYPALYQTQATYTQIAFEDYTTWDAYTNRTNLPLFLTDVQYDPEDEGYTLLPDFGFDFMIHGENYRNFTYVVTNSYIVFSKMGIPVVKYIPDSFELYTPTLFISSGDNIVNFISYFSGTYNGKAAMYIFFDAIDYGDNELVSRLCIILTEDHKITIIIKKHESSEDSLHSGLWDGINQSWMLTLPGHDSYPYVPQYDVSYEIVLTRNYVGYDAMTVEGKSYFFGNMEMNGNMFLTGNVGIGTTNPSQKLDVNGTVRATQFIGDGSLLTGISSGWSSNTSSVYNTTNNIGIGTATPLAKLDVNGAIKSTDAELGTFTVLNQILFPTSPLATTFPSTTYNGITFTFSSITSSYQDYNGNWLYDFAAGTNSTWTMFGFNNGVYTGIATVNGIGGPQLVINGSAPFVLQGYRFMSYITSFSQYPKKLYLVGLDIQTSTFTTLDEYIVSSTNEYSSAILDVIGGVNLYGLDRKVSNTTAYSKYYLIINELFGGIGFNIDEQRWYLATPQVYPRVKSSNDTTTIYGNVGIGTTNPSQTLDVNGTVRATQFIGDGSLITGISSGNTAWSSNSSSVYNTTNNIGIGTTNPLAKTHVYYTGTGDILRVDDATAPDTTPFIIREDGNVGIGTATPLAKTHIYHTDVGDILRVDDGNTVPDTTPFIIREDGNVGIGTSNPLQKLHVVGSISIQGDIVPTGCNLYDLGSSNFRFRDIYLSGNTIDMEGTKITRDTNGSISIKDGTSELLSISANSMILQTSNTSTLIATPPSAYYTATIDALSSSLSGSTIQQWGGFTPAIQGPTYQSVGGYKGVSSYAVFNRSVQNVLRRADFGLTLSNGFTTSLLCKFTGSPSSSETIIDIGNQNQHELIFYRASTSTNFTLLHQGNYSSTFFTNVLSIPQNQWVHVTLRGTYGYLDGSSNLTVDSYYNGVLSGSTTQNISSKFLSSQQSAFGGSRIGQGTSLGGKTQFNGEIAAFYFYNYPLTNNELSLLHRYYTVARTTSAIRIENESKGTAIQISAFDQNVRMLQFESIYSPDFGFANFSCNVGLTLGVNSSNSLNLAFSGNVGIGSTQPTQALDVTGTIKATQFLGDGSLLTGISSGNTAWSSNVSSVYNTTNNIGIGTTIPLAKTHIYYTGTGDILRVDDGSTIPDTTPFVIKDDGNVGIGITNPRSKLELASVGTSEFTLSSTSGFGPAQLSFYSDRNTGTEWRPGYVISADNGNFTGRLDFFTNGVGVGNKFGAVYAMSVSNGRVGIGSSIPSQALDVNGTVKATTFTGSGALLTSLDAGNISAGTLSVGRGGIGTTSLTVNKLLVGNGTNAITQPTELHWDGANLGIGTITPIAKTHVYYTGTGDILRVDDSIGDTTPFIINQDGNVGIGTTNPTDKLQVNGGIIAGTLSLSGSPLISVYIPNYGTSQKVNASPSLTLDFSYPVLFQYYTLKGDANSGFWNRQPIDFTIQASVDNITYTVIDTRTSVNWGNVNTQTFIPTTAVTKYYRYFRMVPTALGDNALDIYYPEWYIYAAQVPQITSEFNLFGTPAIHGGAHLQGTMSMNSNTNITWRPETSSQFMLQSPNGLTWKKEFIFYGGGALTTIVRLRKGSELTLYENRTTHEFMTNPNFDSNTYGILKEVSTNSTLYHAFNNIWVGSTGDTSVGVVFEEQDNGGFRIRTGYNGYYIGYNEIRDIVQQYAPGSANIVTWHKVPVGGPSIGYTNNSLLLQSSVSSNEPIIFRQNNGEVMRLVSGNVGIGTISPLAKTHLYHTGTGDILRVDDSNAPDTTPFIINQDGRVGIGSSQPTQALDVNGTIKATQFLGDGSLLTGISIGSSAWSSNISSVYNTTNNIGIGTTTPLAKAHIYHTGAGDILRVDDGSTEPDTTPFIINQDGNVGIGSSQPSQLLDVVGTIKATSFTGNGSLLTSLDAGNISAGTLIVGRGGIGTTSLTVNKLLVGNGTSAITQPTELHWDGANLGIGTITPLAKTHVYHTGNSDILRVDDATAPDTTPFMINQDGNVGIGTSSPLASLQVNGDIVLGNNGRTIRTHTMLMIGNVEGTAKTYFTSFSSFKMIVTSQRSTVTERYVIYEEFEVLWNMATTPRIVNRKYFKQQELRFVYPAKFYFDSSTNTFTIEHERNFFGNGMRVSYNIIGHLSADPTYGFNNTPPTGTLITNIEGLNIDTSGNIGIGTDNPATALVVNGTIRNVNGPAPTSGTSLVITGDGDIAPQSSDARYKNDIEDIPSVLDAVMNMRAVSYRWKDEPQKWYGLLAQQIAEVFPDAAWHDAEKDTFGVHYTPSIVTLLLKAMQEMKQSHDARIAVLEKEIEQLKSK
jgi:hypothetical protein